MSLALIVFLLSTTPQKHVQLVRRVSSITSKVSSSVWDGLLGAADWEIAAGLASDFAAGLGIDLAAVLFTFLGLLASN